MTDMFSSPEFQRPSPATPFGSAFTPAAPGLEQPWQPVPEAARPPHHPPPAHHEDLRPLRSAYRRQRRTATCVVLGSFTLLLLLSAFAPSLMAGTVSGGLSAGLLLALLQVPVIWLSIWLYERTAHRAVDPVADRLRRHDATSAGRGAAR